MKHAHLLEQLQGSLEDWYESHRPDSGRNPERYVVCAGLAVLEAARSSFPLMQEDFITPGNQVKTGGPLIKQILLRYGETRTYAREGGRTTRGTRPAAERLVEKLNSIEEFGTIPVEERLKILDQLQGWLVDRVREYFNRSKLEIEVAPDAPEKAAENLRNGFRAILLVPERSLSGARSMAETMRLDRKIGIIGIESFVGQNIEEMAAFNKRDIAKGFHSLLSMYNQRVTDAETDVSLLIEIPANLL